MKIILALVVVIVYWCLDAYQAVLNFHISFKEAIFLDYTPSNVLIKLSIVATIFLVFLLQSKVKNSEKIVKKESSTKTLDTISEITDIALSPMSLHKQLDSFVESIEKNLNIKTAFVASYEKDKILLLNSNKSLSKIGIKKEYRPYLENTTKESIDSLLSICYLEKRDFIDSKIKIDGISYKVFLRPYKDNYSTKHIGVVAIIVKKEDSNDYGNFLNKVCELVSFGVNLAKRKEEAIAAQNLYNDQFLSIDRQLNIPSHAKVQERIELEIKRSQRYKTELSIMLVKIDHMENLSNIFNQEETMALKKEVAAILKKHIRETDMFGKWSDTIFAFVISDIDFRATKGFANKLIRQLAEHRFSKAGRITCSYGITSFSPKDTIGGFRKRAENALNTAISKGENSIEIKILV